MVTEAAHTRLRTTETGRGNKKQEQDEDKQQAETNSKDVLILAPTPGRNGNIHDFAGPPKKVKRNDTPYAVKDWSPLVVLMLFFTNIFPLLTE
jgi:hypothetical protein